MLALIAQPAPWPKGLGLEVGASEDLTLSPQSYVAGPGREQILFSPMHIPCSSVILCLSLSVCLNFRNIRQVPKGLVQSIFEKAILKFCFVLFSCMCISKAAAYT